MSLSLYKSNPNLPFSHTFTFSRLPFLNPNLSSTSEPFVSLLKMTKNPSIAQKKANSSKRKQGECSQASINRLDTWFIDENKKNDFKMIYAVKNVRIPKFLNWEWFSQ